MEFVKIPENIKKGISLDIINPRMILNLVYKFSTAVYLCSNTVTKILLK